MPFQKENTHGKHSNHARGFECRNLDQLKNMKWMQKDGKAVRVQANQIDLFKLTGWQPGRPSPSKETRERQAVSQNARTDRSKLSRTPENCRLRQYKCRYKKTLEDFEETLLNQDGHCALCISTGTAKRRLCWDHDHNCCSGYLTCGKCVRGLLCIACNKFMGHLEEVLKQGTFVPNLGTWAEAAINYLNSYKITP
jgi:Recombination endonuclease VII